MLMKTMPSGSNRVEPVRIGIDVGGTFTDVLLVDTFGNRWHVKVRSTPKDLSKGVIEGLQRILDNANIPSTKVQYLLHGSTVATNAVLQRKGSSISLMVTKGFEDLLQIGRQQRSDLYDLFVERSAPLVQRNHIFGVSERILPDGSVHLALTTKEAQTAAKRAVKDVEAIAICLLFAYRNSVHEHQLRNQIQQINSHLPLSCSSTILPEYREYERMSTTVLNAYVTPVLKQYLQNLENALGKIKTTTPMLVMQSHGGVLQSIFAGKQAARLLFSGLAGGTLGARFTSVLLNQKNVISFDMGGTSTDVALILDNEIRETSEGQISGYPCRVPMVDVETVGAGGGSIGWIDKGGILRVGPHSAGADPGPASYGTGGEKATVTDANLVLGRLNPDFFLGGRIPLKLELARKSIRKLGRKLSLSEQACAFGIIRVVNANMERAIRVVSIQRGFDPRDFALVAFGGAGPMHAWALAEHLGIPQVIIPTAPGLHSALGLLATDLRVDQSQTILESSKAPNLKRIESTFKELERPLRKMLQNQGVSQAAISISRFTDLRYKGQAYEIRVPTPRSRISKNWLKELISLFHTQHKRQYGFATVSAPVTIVNLRVIAQASMPVLKPSTIPKQGKKSPIPESQRTVYYEEVGGFVDTPSYRRSALGEGAEIIGPAIVEQLDSTTVIHPNTRASVKTGGNIVLEASS